MSPYGVQARLVTRILASSGSSIFQNALHKYVQVSKVELKCTYATYASDKHTSRSSSRSSGPAIKMEDIVKKLVQSDLINDEQPSVDVFDLDNFRSRCKSLQSAFPESFFNHAMAVKANPIRGIMLEAAALGFGAEAASLQEAKHALSLGFPPDKVVFDSPCKTPVELREAVDLGLHMNLDNEVELGVVDEYIKASGVDKVPTIGLRINPVVGGGSIAMFNVATKLSKFGVPLVEETRDRILGMFRDHAWMTGVHIHVGSQGVPLEKFVAGVNVLMQFVRDVEKHRPGQIVTIDIGGGLSTTYTEADEPTAFEYRQYREDLEREVPELFSGKYNVVTEMGRSLFLKSGTTLTRVEYVKEWIDGQNPIILTHVGTNQFPREAYLPQQWRHRFSLFDKDGLAKSGDEMMIDLAGPLCFQGDFLAKDVNLPRPVAGDIVAMYDTGAYTMAMYCKFCSIRASPVYGAERTDRGVEFTCFKERETVEENLAFWGLQQPIKLNS